MNCLGKLPEKEAMQVEAAMQMVFEAYQLRMLEATAHNVCPLCHAYLEADVLIAAMFQHTGLNEGQIAALLNRCYDKAKSKFGEEAQKTPPPRLN